MKNKSKKELIVAISSIILFSVWSLLLKFIDVKAIGPMNTPVGFSSLNQFVHDFTGVHMPLYYVTDWMGIIPILVAFAFAILGTIQLIRRKSILKVDRSIITLGVFYIIVIALYLFFEAVVINYRPVLINGCLEASYPSSTTLLTMCVMPTAATQINLRIKNHILKKILVIAIIVFTAFMVIARIISGVHWITDIIGGIILSTGLVELYRFMIQLKNNYNQSNNS